MINSEANKQRPRNEVNGFIPGLHNLGPEALANLAQALAKEPGAYNSSETLAQVIAKKTEESAAK